MECSVHLDRPAVANCVQCGSNVCPECKVIYENKVYCNQCIEKKIAASSTAAHISATPTEVNTSGMGKTAVVPAELGDWNWGGFLLTWIWGIGNNVWWSFLFFVPYVGWLVMPWVLAFKGNQWAWQNRKWDSVEHFKKAQSAWMKWGFGLTIAITLLTVLMIALLALGLYFSISESV